MSEVEDEKPQKRWAPLGKDLQSEKESVESLVEYLGGVHSRLAETLKNPKWDEVKLILSDLNGITDAILDGYVQQSQPRIRTAIFDLHERVQEIIGGKELSPEQEKLREEHLSCCKSLLYFVAHSGLSAENHSFGLNPARSR